MVPAVWCGCLITYITAAMTMTHPTSLLRISITCPSDEPAAPGLAKTGTVVFMNAEQDAADRQRKLRLAQSAAASAVGNGCDPDEVRRAVEAGIAEALALNARFDNRRSEWPPAPAGGALDDWAHRVNAA